MPRRHRCSVRARQHPTDKFTARTRLKAIATTASWQRYPRPGQGVGQRAYAQHPAPQFHPPSRYSSPWWAARRTHGIARGRLTFQQLDRVRPIRRTRRLACLLPNTGSVRLPGSFARRCAYRWCAYRYRRADRRNPIRGSASSPRLAKSGFACCDQATARWIEKSMYGTAVRS